MSQDKQAPGAGRKREPARHKNNPLARKAGAAARAPKTVGGVKVGATGAHINRATPPPPEEETPPAKTPAPRVGDAITVAPAKALVPVAEPEPAYEPEQEPILQTVEMQPLDVPDTAGEDELSTLLAAMDTAEQDAPEEDPADERERHLAEMTRTVQVSVQRILAEAEAAEAARAAETPDDDLPPEEYPEEFLEEKPAAPRRSGARVRVEPPADDEALALRIGRGVGRSVTGFVKWLALVVFLVALLVGGIVAWMYRSATADRLPNITATIDGQALSPTAYDWRVPVINDVFTRRYAKTLSEEPITLPLALTSLTPELTVTPESYESTITVWDTAGNELFSGDPLRFTRFTFSQNGTYVARLAVQNARDRFAGTASVTGTQIYDFCFEVSIRPSLRLDTNNVKQGSIVAAMVTGISQMEQPTLESTLGTATFVPAQNGWVAYLPIPYDQAPGGYQVTINAGAYSEVLNLTVSEQKDFTALDYKTAGELNWAYIGPNETPQDVWQALDVVDETVAWANDGFVLPYVDAMTVTLPYGCTEYIGRTQQEKDANTGSGRTTINMAATGKYGNQLISPAAGRVVLARDLGDNDGEGLPGKTIVIEHGGGVKSVFYNLDSFAVQEGDIVLQRQPIGTTQYTFIAGTYVGRVPVDPMQVWRSQSNALRCH